jgi:hypothetical protein
MADTFKEALRSDGFPMCPNYWDANGEDDGEGGPMNRYSMNQQIAAPQDNLFYKFPTKKVGSPLIGDPELSFCRKWQEKYDATCCLTYLDEDIQEEYEELAGAGYLGAHVFLQQFLCLPCHPMISCMINEATDTLEIPLEFAKRLVRAVSTVERGVGRWVQPRVGRSPRLSRPALPNAARMMGAAVCGDAPTCRRTRSTTSIGPG